MPYITYYKKTAAPCYTEIERFPPRVLTLYCHYGQHNSKAYDFQ